MRQRCKRHTSGAQPLGQRCRLGGEEDAHVDGLAARQVDVRALGLDRDPVGLCVAGRGDAARRVDPAASGAPSVPSGGPSASGGERPSPSPPSGVAVWLPEWATEVPHAVTGRRRLPFCGVERAPAPQAGEFIDRSVRLCFWSAAQAGAEAEFASIQGTIEGGTIATIYRLTSGGTVEILTDTTQDSFGAGGWVRAVCGRVVEGESQSLVGVADCGESTKLK